ILLDCNDLLQVYPIQAQDITRRHTFIQLLVVRYSNVLLQKQLNRPNFNPWRDLFNSSIYSCQILFI
ncbi:hypothetical protein L9F63_020578, partial [Diploptera punctata]